MKSNSLFEGTDFKFATYDGPVDGRISRECGFTSLSVRVVKVFSVSLVLNLYFSYKFSSLRSTDKFFADMTSVSYFLSSSFLLALFFFNLMAY